EMVGQGLDRHEASLPYELADLLAPRLLTHRLAPRCHFSKMIHGSDYPLFKFEPEALSRRPCASQIWPRMNAPALPIARRPGSSRAFHSGQAWIICSQISRRTDTSAAPAAAAKRVASA